MTLGFEGSIVKCNFVSEAMAHWTRVGRQLGLCGVGNHSLLFCEKHKGKKTSQHVGLELGFYNLLVIRTM